MLKVLHKIIYSPRNTPTKYSFVSKIDNEYVLIDSKTLYNSKELNIIDKFRKTYYRGVLSTFLLFCLDTRRTQKIIKIQNKVRENKIRKKNKNNKKRRSRKKRNRRR